MKTRIKLLLFFLPLFFTQSESFAQSDFMTIRARIRQDLTGNGNDRKLTEKVAELLSTQQRNGSWADINYTDLSSTKWAPAEHLDRLKTLAAAGTKSEIVSATQQQVYNAIVSALRYWYSTDPKSGNWWHNEIATPQDLGEIIILLSDSPNRLPASLTDSLVTRMKRGNPYAKTGANKLDIAIHYLYRACITENKPLMDSAVEQAFQPIVLTTEEGLQYDYSYQQHGAQLQVSSYGLVFLGGEYKIASLVRGTPYALSGEQLALLGRYLVHTFLPAIRGRYIDFNTEGRGIARPDILDKEKLSAKGGLLYKALALHPEYRGKIEAAIAHISGATSAGFNVSPLHNYFWKADYTQHLRTGYSFNVRTVSTRTKRTETGNRENLLGRFLPDGSTNIQRSGAEYYNIMPVWEWDKIPGVTSRSFEKDPPFTVEWGEAGSTRFTGGVSDSLYGATAYDMDYNGVKAKKAWFFFDREVVCLGAGIQSTSAEAVTTTLNQCWLNGPAILVTGGQMTPLQGDAFTGMATGIWHDSIGYFFPMANEVTVTSKVQKGKWADINAKTSEKEISGKVFKVWYNHGIAPQNASYAYVVMPGISAADMVEKGSNEVTILENSTDLQAVQHKGLQMLQAVFYKPGKVTFGTYSIAVDKPCALLLRQAGNRLELHLSDPAQTEDTITVTLRNTSTGGTKEMRCPLPKGNYSGATVFNTVSLP